MIGLIQRVTGASVSVAEEEIASIGQGLLVLVGVERGDTQHEADRLAERLLAYRVFADADGRMNRSVMDIEGSVLLVPQFTLVADTAKGKRPGFSRAADPEVGRTMFAGLLDATREQCAEVQSGTFGANMQVSLVNDGPVTFWLQVSQDG
jgi:D-tyrosyl-tRNA(Tyr) deacylase